MKVRAVESIVHTGGDTEVVVPKETVGAVTGANRIQVPSSLARQDLRLTVVWNEVAVWYRGDGNERRKSVLYADWADTEVQPDDVEVVA